MCVVMQLLLIVYCFIFLRLSRWDAFYFEVINSGKVSETPGYYTTQYIGEKYLLNVDWGINLVTKNHWSPQIANVI